MRPLTMALLLLAITGCSEPEYILSGQIKDVTTGKPIEGATVLIAGLGGPAETTTADGRFSIYLVLLPTQARSNWQLKLSAEGYESETVDVRVLLDDDGRPVHIYVQAYLRPVSAAEE